MMAVLPGAMNYGSRIDYKKECERWHRMWRMEKFLRIRSQGYGGSYLDTAGCRIPDLLIRTSGEQNFQFPYVAAELIRDLFYRRGMADFHKARISTGY